MTEDMRGALRVLLDRHSHNVRRSLYETMIKVLPVPAVRRAFQTWQREGRAREFESLEETVNQIVAVLHKPVTKTVVANRRGFELDLVTLPQAASRLGYHPSTLGDLSAQKDDFPTPLLSTDTTRIYVFEDIESWVAARRAVSEFRTTQGSRPKAPPNRTKST